MREPRTLLLDIETSPNVAYTFDLWRTTIAPVKIIEVSRVLCFAAKWLGEKQMHFHSVYNKVNGAIQESDRMAMIEAAWKLLDEADIVIHYNGYAFDIPYLNREFLHAGLTPPSPFKQIDLLQTIRKVFQFPSNQLAHVSKELGLEGKIEHEGFMLWIKCMEGNSTAWNKMEKYNRRDVVLLEELYELLRPWAISHPNYNVWTGASQACPACGSANVQRRGYSHTTVSKFQRYQCQECGKWFRDTHRITGADVTNATT